MGLTRLSTMMVEQTELQKSWIKGDLVDHYCGSDSEASDGEDGDSELSDSWTGDTTPSRALAVDS